MKLFQLILVGLSWVTAFAQTNTTDANQTPHFEDYPVTEMFTGTPAEPISTPEQRHYRARIRNGVLTGAGVWNRSWGYLLLSSRYTTK
jgi:hypothetical protein